MQPVHTAPSQPTGPHPSAQQHPQNATPQTAEPEEPLDPNNEIVQGMQHQEETITELMSMGFEREKVKQALAAAFFNKDRAVDYLINVF